MDRIHLIHGATFMERIIEKDLTPYALEEIIRVMIKRGFKPIHIIKAGYSSEYRCLMLQRGVDLIWMIASDESIRLVYER